MKSLVTVVLQYIKDRPSRVNAMALARFTGLVIALIAIYSIIFHWIMEYEGRSESWITGVYWTLTVMSTLGFGDITFQSDLGKAFSIVVMLSGLLFLLVLLPFTFIELFYTPWVKAQKAARAPRELPAEMRSHVILTRFDNVTRTLVERFRNYHYSYVILTPDQSEALALNDEGYKVMLGDLDHPDTWRQARVGEALAVVATQSDQLNANVAITVREVSETTPVIATANFRVSIDILNLAGCTYVLHVAGLMGEALARQAPRGAVTAQIIGNFDDLQIAEAPVRGTALVGKTLEASNLREETGVNVLGMWRRGVYEDPTPDALIGADTVLVLAGLSSQVAAYNTRYSVPTVERVPVIIIGGGRVGRAAGRALDARGLDYRIIEKDTTRIRDPEKYIVGDAAAHEVLEDANISAAHTVIITTHDDDMNVYLAIYCRQLAPRAQIICRANLDRNIATLHRAGADFVLSYASLGANAIINHLGHDNILMVSEGLDIFEVAIPEALAGKSIAESEIRSESGCTVVALRENGAIDVMPAPDAILPEGGRMVLIGGAEAEKEFLERWDE